MGFHSVSWIINWNESHSQHRTKYNATEIYSNEDYQLIQKNLMYNIMIILYVGLEYL